MIKVSVLYPNQEGGRFDIAYYCQKHIPMVQRLCGTALKGVAVDQGLCGMTPASPASFLAMGHLLFESTNAFQAAFGAHLNEIVSDVPNYTNAQPLIQISEVKL